MPEADGAALGSSLAVAVVGAGKSGLQHVEAAKRVGLRVAAYADPDPAAIIPQARRMDLADILRSPWIDAVAFCIPPGMRFSAVQRACDAGKLVMVEKPPALRLAELQDLLAVIEPASEPLIMLQNRALLSGKPQPPLLSEARGFVRVRRPREPRHWIGWRADVSVNGGGATAHLGIHYLDLAVQFLGPVLAANITRREEIAPGVDVCIEGTLRFAAESMLNIEVTTTSDSSLQEIFIESNNSTMTMKNGLLTWAANGLDYTSGPRSAADLRAELYRILLARAEGKPPPPCHLLSSACETQRLLDLIYEAPSGRQP